MSRAAGAGAPRFGVFLPQLRMGFEEIAEKARLAEALGYDSVWFMDHLMTPAAPELPCLEGWSVACAVAARTSRIRIGHLVLCNGFRPPALLAKMAASLDAISGGRLELGIGWGSLPEELERCGYGAESAADKAARLEETLAILDLLFEGKPVSHRGRFCELRDVVCQPTPVQRPLPIHVGGSGERLTLPLAARRGGWWNCPSYGADRLAELAPLAAPARISVQHPVGLVRDAAQRAEVERLAQRRFGNWGGLRVGTAEELARAFTQEVELGAELFVLQFHDFGARASLEAFARDVAPRVVARG